MAGDLEGLADQGSPPSSFLPQSPPGIWHSRAVEVA